jgi:hypothetical protein
VPARAPAFGESAPVMVDDRIARARPGRPVGEPRWHAATMQLATSDMRRHAVLFLRTLQGSDKRRSGVRRERP